VAERYPTFLSGQTLTADLLVAAQPIVVRKQVDTSRASTTTTTADPELTFSVEANAVYTWDGWLKYFADPTPDMVVDFTIPTGSLGEWSAYSAGNTTAGSTAAGYLIRTDSNDVSQARNLYGTSDVPLTALINGTLRVGSTSGTFSLDWAQGTSSATASILYTDSWMRLQRIK
jgi:hypothetical protein